jgi:putative ABC transport system permease protein
MTGLAWELRRAARTLGHARGFTAIAALALGLGIGANSAIFSVLDAVMIRPLPYPDADRLVAVWEDASYISFPHNTPAPGNFADWAKQNTVFSGMAAMRFASGNLSGADGPPEVLLGRRVTANFFGVLGVKPELGRAFTEQEDRESARVAIISHSLWQRRFAGERTVLGRLLVLDGESRTVIGVMPRQFRFPTGREDYWTPVSFTPKDLANRGQHYLTVVARLKPGVSVAQAGAEMSAIARRLEQDHPESNRRLGAVVVPLREEMTGKTGAGLTILLGASTIVLLIACSNIANLMLARGWARRREYAVRSALGAGRWQLMRPLVAEALLCSAAGAGLALALAWAASRTLAVVVPEALAGSGGVGVNGRVLGFTALAAVATTMLSGLAPALAAGRTAGSGGDLKLGTRSTAHGGWWRSVLVVAEVSLAMVLLVAAGLMVETLARLHALDMGFKPDHLLTLITPFGGPGYKDDVVRRAYFEGVLERVRPIAGVEGAGFSSNLPFTSAGNTNSFRIEGRPEPSPGNAQDALYREVTAGYLETMKARLLAGRFIEARDTAEAPGAVVISAAFARAYFPDGALGHRMTLGSSSPEAKRWTVVGVVDDMRERGYTRDVKPAVYVPALQAEEPEPFYLAVRTAGDPMAALNAVRRAVWAVDPQVPVSYVHTMEDLLDLDIADRRRQMTVLGVFAGLAVLLAGIGIYGVLAFAVTQRTREIGVRVAVGATRAQVVSMVGRQGGALLAAGVVMGTLLALGATRVMASQVYGVETSDPAIYGAVAAGLVLVGMAACLMPAWRASRIDPVIALRDE